jgi:hypothetical protein
LTDRSALDTVFFLSDYGRRDEFAGVVHAVLRRLAPRVTLVDVTHDIPPFDVRAGAAALARAAPHLGPGVVLAVVDPGVGGPRRAVVAETVPGPGPAFLVGPDNGLLLPAADALGGIARAVDLGRPSVRGPATFDGRDVFAPAAAALCNGEDPTALGPPVDPTGLERVADPVVERTRVADGRRLVRAEVTWVDRFGNVQLAVAGSEVPTGPGAVGVSAAAPAGGPQVGEIGVGPVRRVRTFSDLEPGEVGLIADSSDRLALVVREGSAADRTGINPGMLVELVW